MKYSLLFIVCIAVGIQLTTQQTNISIGLNTLLIGANYTFAKIITDSYEISTRTYKQKTIDIKPNSPTKSVRPICKHDVRYKLTTMLYVVDATVSGVLIRNNSIFFFDALDNTRTPANLPPPFILKSHKYYDGVIYSYESFQNNMNEVFYWTRVCENQNFAGTPDSSTLNCRVGTTKYRQYVHMFKYTKDIDRLEVVTNFFARPYEDYNVNMIEGASSSYSSSTLNYYVQLAIGKNALGSRKEPTTKRYVLLTYVSSHVYGINLAGEYTILAVAAGPHISSMDATVYMLGTKAGKSYILSTRININGYPYYLSMPTEVVELSNPQMRFQNLSTKMAIDIATNQLMFLATHSVSRKRLLVFYNYSSNTWHAIESTSWNYHCLTVNRG